MTARDPLFVVGAAGAGQTSPTEARLALAGLIAPSTGAGARSGVLYGAGSPLAVTGTSGMSYSVAAGQAVADRGSTALGSYLGSNDAAATVTTTAAPGTAGQSRYDVIWIRFPDAEQGDANSAAVLGVTQGTASASPTVPAIPTGALALAQALVPNGATRTDTLVTITQVAPWTVARGAAVPVRSSTERGALSTYSGLTAYRIDTGRTEQWTPSGAWATIADPGAWTSFTPTWTSSGTNPSLGNGTLAGRWTQVGKRVDFTIVLTSGSTTTYGTGVWQFGNLPFSQVTLGGRLWVPAMATDISAGGRYVCYAYWLNSGAITLQTTSSGPAMVNVDATTPFTWASGDQMVVNGSLEVA